MKNYTVVSRMCDEISSLVLGFKLDATDPTKPDYVRIQAQRRLACVRDFLIYESRSCYSYRDEDLPF